MKTYLRLISYAKPLGRYAIPYILFTLLAIVFSTLNLALLAPLLNTLLDQNSKTITEKPEHFYEIFKAFNYYTSYANAHYGIYRTLQFVCLVIVSSVLLGNIFRYLSDRTMENLRIHTLLNLRRAVFDNVMKLDISYFNNQRKGDIMSKVSADVQVVQYTVTGTLQVLFKEPITLICYLLLLFIISYKITLIAMLVIPLAGFIISRIVKRLKQDAIASHVSYGIMLSYLDEALNGIRIIKAFNAIGFVTDRFHRENVHYSNIIRSMARRQQLASPVSEFLGALTVAFIVLYGGSLVLSNDGDLNGANFIAYIALFSQIMRPAKAISASFSNIHSGIAAGERVLALIDQRPTIIDSPAAAPKEKFDTSLEMKNVSFAYGDNEVLHDITISIPKGKTVALVGPSGAGKSTLMDLLPRFIQPHSGCISIDGKKLEDVSISSLRSMMGIVGQESVLFNDTIFHNIAFGKPGTTLAEVEAAAKIANAHDFISVMANGYETNIGDRGVKLSGGQRQRICIARAVLNNPPIMLLDEATSSLDTESEKLVQDALTNLMKNRTTLIIAHRLSTVQNADIILVLDNGKIVEQGNHRELLANGGLYKKLTNMQTFLSD